MALSFLKFLFLSNKSVLSPISEFSPSYSKYTSFFYLLCPLFNTFRQWVSLFRNPVTPFRNSA